MTTSGTYVWDASRNQIIASALRKIAAIAEGEFASVEMLGPAIFVLEGIIKEAEADGMPLWAIIETTIPFSSFTNGATSLGIGQTVNVAAPLKVLSAYNRDPTNPGNPIDIPMTILTHYDYNWLSSKYAQGTPVQFFYNPGNQVGELKVWPIPDTYSQTNRQMVITYQRPFQDAGGEDATLDFPQYWLTAIIHRLAWLLAPEYGVPPNDRTILAKEADLLWNRALSFGTEEGSLFVEPDWSRMTLGRGFRR